MPGQRQKLQAVFGVLLLISVGPTSGLTAGLDGVGVAAAGNHAGMAGNQPTSTAGNQPTASGAGNQPTDSPTVTWNNSTAPEANETAELDPRANDSQPYPIVGDQQPTDPNGDGLYEDINGDGAVNIVDADALRRHLSNTSVGANWSAYDFTGDNRTDVGDVLWLFNATQSPVINDSDGDGLPNEYELNVTETDPSQADSDDDGRIDGFEDFDGDNLTAYNEYRLGTDPRSNDTDGDGLSDEFEATRPGLDPTTADTDDDGVRDPQEDVDGDNLSVTNETSYETIIGLADTDGDDLDDGAEVHVYGTNATVPDTDDDGLDDGEEIRLGTDPLVADTDGNGVLDGNETYQTNTSNSSLGVSLSLTGNGDIANDTTIEPQDDPMFNSSRVDNMSQSPVVELESAQNFSSANVTMEYNETGVTNESRELTVFTYDPEIGIFVPLNSTIDTENNTVTAETTHFSTFAVYNLETWETTYDAEEPVRETDDDGIVPVDVALVMDTSGSMDDDENLRNQAGQQFVSGLLDVDRAAVVDFDHDATVAQELTSDFSAVNSTLDSLGGSGGTDIDDGVSAANSHFASNSNDSRAQVMILLTDGQGDGGISEARTAAERNTTIHTVGFDNANQDKLQEIANITGGEYNYVADSSELPQVFSRVANNTTDITDSDGDGLSNRQETEGMTLGTPTGEFVQTDPYQSDTDGDGLSDGREVGEHQEVEHYLPRADITYTVSFYEYSSNPTRLDSDSDGVPDGEEVNEWDTDPLDPDTSDDGMNDLVDPDPTEETYPPEFAYQSWTVEGSVGVDVGGTTFRPLQIYRLDHFAVAADALGDAEGIERIHIRQNIQSWVPWVESGWRNETFTQSDFQEAENSDRIYVTTGFGDIGNQVTPDQIIIVVEDTNGNTAYVNHDVDDNSIDMSAVAAAGEQISAFQGALLAGGAAGAGYAGGVTTSGSISSTSVVATGSVAASSAIAVSGFAVLAEDTGSASGASVQASYTRTVPATEVVRQWEEEELYSVALYSNNDIELPLRLPAGEIYEAPSGEEGFDRGFGEEYIYRTPGINDQGDINEVLQQPNAIEQQGDYTLVIGDNPDGQGEIGIWIIDGLIINTGYQAYDSARGEHIDISDDVVDKIANRRQDWDHNQLGNDEQTVRQSLREIINNPDEIYEDPAQNRWMYVRQMNLNGREVIVTLFVMNGEVATAFVPTHPRYTGARGYSDNHAEWYIQDQQMIKRYEPGDSILPSTNIGDQPPNPGQRPDPTT